MKLALASSLSIVALVLVACSSEKAPTTTSSADAVTSRSHSSTADCEDSAHEESDGCYDADHNIQDPSCCKAGDDDDSTAGGGSNCEDEDGATCMKSKSACLAAGGQPDGNDCNGSSTGLSFCCAMN